MKNFFDLKQSPVLRKLGFFKTKPQNKSFQFHVPDPVVASKTRTRQRSCRGVNYRKAKTAELWKAWRRRSESSSWRLIFAAPFPANADLQKSIQKRFPNQEIRYADPHS